VCYPHNGGATVPDLVESCLRSVEEGWKFVRWGLPEEDGLLEPRQAVRKAIQEFQAVREAAGEEIEITFDVHTRLDLPDAVTLCREAEAFHPFFMEDPLRSENPDSFKTLRPRTSAPLAAGEQFSSKWEFQLVEEEWIDYARVDLCIVGGFTERGRSPAGARRYIKMSMHNPLGPFPRRLPPVQPGRAELRRAGAAAQAGRPGRCGAGAARVGRRLPAAIRSPRVRRQVRS
jgi:galactonate dehydratase